MAEAMCLTLFAATKSVQPLRRSPYLSIQDPQPNELAVRQWMTLPEVRFIGSCTGCSCGFEYIICDSVFDFYEGMFEYDEDQQDELRSLTELIDYVRAFVEVDGEVELFPIWNGEAKPPLGIVERTVDQLEPRTFFFVEQFLYRVRRATGDQPAAGISSIEK